MSWKQPVPTDLHTIFGEDYRCMALYQQLLLRSCTRDTIVALNKKTVPLKRGQVLFGRRQFSRYVCWDSKTTERALKKIEKVYQLVTLQVNHDYTLVEILNYDEICKLDPPSDPAVTQQRPGSDPAVTTSKNNKNNKNNKSKKKDNNISPISEEKSEDVKQIVEVYKKNIDPNAVLTKKAREKIQTRLQEFPVKQLHEAMIRFFFDKWRMENNAKNGMSWFFDSEDRIAKFLSLKPTRHDAPFITRLGTELTSDQLSGS